MARRSEHSLEEIKEMVLRAAETIVIERGFAALTMRKIAMEMGYTVGSIYMVFANMADLVMQMNARTLDEIAGQLEQVQDVAPAVCIEELARTYLQYANLNFHRWSLIFEYRLPDDFAIPEAYQKKVDTIFGGLEAQFARLAPGCSEAEKKLAARALWAGIHGVCMLSLTGKMAIAGANDLEDSVVLLVRNFIKGWRDSMVKAD